MGHFPITIERESFQHRQGSKAYHAFVASNVDGKSVVIYRYGKINAFGQLQIKKFDTLASALSEMNGKIRSKTGGRGYESAKGREHFTATTPDQFRSIVGPQLFAKFGADNLLHLSPDFDTSKVSDPPPAIYDEDGRSVPVETDKYHVPDVPVSIEERRAKNPNFGIF